MRSAKSVRRLAAAVFGLGVALAASARTASAGTTSCMLSSDMATSKRKLATFEDMASYDSDTHKLSITLKNTSKRGVLTGFAFKTPLAGVTYVDGDVAGTKADEDKFDSLLRKGKTSRKLSPFAGTYNAGALLNGQWTARPSRKYGILEGQSRTFVFDVSDAGAAGMGITNVMDAYGSLGLVTAFKDVKAWKSDRVAAKMTMVVPPAPVVDRTEPGTNLEESPLGGGNNTNPDTNGGSVGPGPATGGGGTTPDGQPPAAVPLPPAALMGLTMMGLIGLGKLRHRIARPA